ncbi:hypothetical protein LR48_Vigan04g133600 [Vigna angularis]|uniref:Uncharacterized protein n=1 Tax=Phaseolus angularis TaxID=3914 RepID=A0A0L9UEH0_PHAAN|nr:hypothetical protein LR48_Vigan04g133600 [Vigna angularis]
MADSRRNRRRTAGASSSRSRNVRPASIEDLFRAQGLTHLVEQKGCIYPDLIGVFYFNLRYRDDIITKKMKDVPIILDDDVWTIVAQLTIWDDAVKVHLGVLDFNHLLAFQSFLRHPEQQINRRHSRGRVIIHKDHDHQEDDNDDMDAHMAHPVQVVAPADPGPSQMLSSSSLTMEEHFANLSKQLEDMRLFQQTYFE